MNAEIPRAIRKVPVHILKGEQVDTYSSILIALLKAARLNKFFPDPASLINLFSFHSPMKNLGLYETLEINELTGLPTEKDTVRVITDKDMALKVLRESSLEELEKKYEMIPSDVNRRRLLRYRYYMALGEVVMPKLFNMELVLRSIDEKEHTAYFTVILDRFDLSENLFARYTIFLYQIDSRWIRPQIELSGDDFSYTENFRNVIARYAASESEFAFVILNDIKNVGVEEVVRARIGPLYFSGVYCPEGIERLVDNFPGSFILSLPTDRASVSIKEDRNNDPFAMLYREFLHNDAREVYEKRFGQTGYHVFKDRKFVCTKNIEGHFKEFLKNIGTKNVVYSVENIK